MKKARQMTNKNGLNKVNDIMKNYITECKLKGMVDETIKSYIYNINFFLNVTNTYNIEEINSQVTKNFILYLRENYENTTTINTMLKSLRPFINYLSNNDYINPITINLLKEQQCIKETYTETELKALLRKPNVKKCSFAEYRNWVAISFLFSTGLRISSVINIKIKDIDLENGWLIVTHTKNNKCLQVPLSISIISIIKEYLTYRKASTDDEYLFIGTYDTQFKANTFTKTIARYNLSRGVTKTSSHLFRHTFAKFYIKNGGNPFMLQRLLGHSTLEMTRKYVTLYSEDVKIGYDMLNPLDRLCKKQNHIKM